MAAHPALGWVEGFESCRVPGAVGSDAGIDPGELQMGEWCRGNMAVSKTVVRGSNPLSPAVMVVRIHASAEERTFGV